MNAATSSELRSGVVGSHSHNDRPATPDGVVTRGDRPLAVGNADAIVPSQFEGSTLLGVMGAPVANVLVYSKAEFAVLTLKCPAIRQYASGAALPASLGANLRSGFNRTLALFEGGGELARAASGCGEASDLAKLDAPGFAAGQPAYSCVQAHSDGSLFCPSGGCVLPSGDLTATPLGLLAWDSVDIKKVGNGAIARSVAASEFGTHWIGLNDKILTNSGGAYKELDQRTKLKRILAHLGPLATVQRAEAIAEFAEIMYVTPTGNVDVSRDFICFKNGTLNLIVGADRKLTQL